MIAIGCPIKNREWILPSWAEHVDAAMREVDHDYCFVFAVDQDEDASPIFDAMSQPTVIVRLEEVSTGERDWQNTDRYTFMANARNQLLDQVARINPDFFLSLDSDILVHPKAIASALKTMDVYEADAVGLKTYLSEGGTRTTNAGVWHDRQLKNSFRRVLADFPVRCDIVMAAKLFRPSIFGVKYEWHHQGEDIGWASNLDGKNVFFDGTYTSKHVMSKDKLGKEDPRLGW